MRDIAFLADMMGISLSDEQRKLFDIYERFLLEYNSIINLTRITDHEEIALKHFADSIAILPIVLKEADVQGSDLMLADVGTGAGFPGMPLKIVMPSLDVTLIDSLKKRTGFLSQLNERLGICGVKVIHARAEDVGNTRELREKFNIVTARAVAALPELCEYCLPLVRVGGVFAAMKAQAVEEINEAGYAISKLGGIVEEVREYFLPGSDVFRTLVLIRKVKTTPAGFPRKAGKPSADPLKGGCK
ncbi:MAG: 16S rRNA (guanine(527)-N(7))-methyltransferase RsmG [Eubacteriales bacterium]|nr:16S rRNA (guanine(527)-N(7))-methyltransferase RsmG [Eubacteriales bacterium]MDD4328162.1 16S rRNA (guanine(527)-N(7))-methyltransferase RsmG [Eubacteriales bacterium]MDD4717396.1 16S rRNA (guanine(527)-N(7))-methyltransferase RsmG [Eubacteriales bacterium]